MRALVRNLIAFLSVLVLSAGAAWAQSGDWQVVETSGTVRTSKPMTGVQLVSTGETFGAGSVLSTGMDGRAVLVRGDQQIVVGPNSRMSLPAAEEKGMTRIVQDLGTLLFKVDKREKQHFRVETPIIAAVVKGTTFTVTAGASGHSVHVAEGAVEVTALNGSASQLVTAGLTARVERNNPRVIKMSNGERSGESAQTPDRSGKSGDAGRGGERKSDRAGSLVVPTKIGGDALDFSNLSDGLVQPSANAATAAQANSGLGADVAANVRGQGGGAAAVAQARHDAGGDFKSANSGQGMDNGNAGGNGKANTGGNGNGKANEGGDGNANGNANPNAGAGNNNGNANGNGNPNAGPGNNNGNANGNGNPNAGAGNNNGNANGNGNPNAGAGNNNGNANGNGNPNAGPGNNNGNANGNGNGGINVGVDAGDVEIEVGVGQSGVNVGGGVGGINLGDN